MGSLVIRTDGSFNTELHLVSDTKNISETDVKISGLRLHAFHPDRQSFLGSLKNSIREFFLGKTAVQIRVLDQDKKTVLKFVKVNDLSQILKMAEKDLLESVKKNEARSTADLIAKRYKQITIPNKQTEPAQAKVNAPPSLESKSKTQKNTDVFQEKFPELKFRDQGKFLASVGKRLGFPTMVNLINEQTTIEKKQMMLNTFIAMGKIMDRSQDFRDSQLIYMKRIKDKNLETHAFALTSEHTYICLSKKFDENKIGSGSFKLATLALKVANASSKALTQPEKVVRIKAKTDVDVDIKQINKDLRRENTLAGLFKDIVRIVKPFMDVFTSSKRSGEAKQIGFLELYKSSAEIFKSKTSLSKKLPVLIDTGKALTEMHKKNIVHCDVKPDNIFLENNSEETKPPKGVLADLGLSTKIGAILSGGTLKYLPPEALVKNNDDFDLNKSCIASPAIDSFAYGMTIFNTFDKEVPIGCLMTYGNTPQEAQNLADEHFSKLKTSIASKAVKQKITIQKNKRLSPSEKEKRLKKIDKNKEDRIATLEVSQKLMQFDPKKRISCLEASTRLEKILNQK